MHSISPASRLRAFGLVILAASLAACGSSHEKEPNDTYQQATALKPGGSISGTIFNPKDVDWYRMEIPSDGVLSAKIGGIRDIDFVLSAFDKDRREIKRIDETTVGGDEQMLDLGVAPGVYYLVVSNKNDAANNPSQEYTLETKFDPPQGREREPNDSALTAQPIDAGDLVHGHYWPTRNLLSDDPNAGEEDWYAVQVKKEGIFLLNVDVSQVRGVDPILEIYDTNGYKLKEVDNGGVDEGESLRNFGVRGPAKYLLRLRSKQKNAGNAQDAYDLLTELVPYQGRTELEPNDQRSDATPFVLEDMQGTIAPAADQDWYKISIDSDGKYLLRAELTGVPGMDLVLTLKDSVGTNLSVIDNGVKEQTEVLTGWGVTRGDYYLVVNEKTGRKFDSHAPYTLTKRLIPWQSGLEWEPNDSSSTAMGIKTGESIDGYIAPKGDQDWFEFNVFQQGTVDIDVTGVINVTPTLAIFDQDNRQVGTATATKSGEPVVLSVPLDRGTYWVRLKPADPSQNNVRDKYTLRVRLR